MKKCLWGVLLVALLVNATTTYALDRSLRYWGVDRTALNFQKINSNGNPEAVLTDFERGYACAGLTLSDGTFVHEAEGTLTQYVPVDFENPDLSTSYSKLHSKDSLPGNGLYQSVMLIPPLMNDCALERVYVSGKDIKKQKIKIESNSFVAEAEEDLLSFATLDTFSITKMPHKFGYWIIGRESDGTSGGKQFRVCEYSVDGILPVADANLPDVAYGNDKRTFMRISPRGDCIIIANPRIDGGNRVHEAVVYSFNDHTGAISYLKTIEVKQTPESLDYPQYQNIEFSSNGDFAYYVIPKTGVYQINLRDDSVAEIATIPESSNALGGTTQLAPTGVVYNLWFDTGDKTKAGVIKSANKAYEADGSGCQWSLDDLYYVEGNADLPMVIASMLYDPGIYMGQGATLSSIGVTRADTSLPTEWGICWSKTNTKPTVSDTKIVATAADLSFTGNIASEVLFGETAYVRGYRTEVGGITRYSDVVTLTHSTHVLPTFSAVSAGTPGKTAVELTATLDPGNSDVTAKGFCLSSQNDPTVADLKFADTGTALTYTVEAKQLIAGATYKYRPYAMLGNGSAIYGSIATVTMAKDAEILPTFSAISAGTPGKTSVELTATMDSGNSDVTAKGFCLSSQSNPTIDDLKFADTGTALTYTVEATQLIAGATYKYRPYAVIANGSAIYGAIATVTMAEDLTAYSGTLVGPDGETPVVGAVVSTPFYRKDGKPVTAVTDVAGHFSLTGIPSNVYGLEFLATADGMLPLEFDDDDLFTGALLQMTASGLTVELTITPKAGPTLPKVIYLTSESGGEFGPRQVASPSGGTIVTKISGKTNPFNIYIDAKGFVSQKIDSTTTSVELEPIAAPANPLATSAPTENPETGLVFTITGAGSKASGDYDVEVYEVSTFDKIDVTLADPEAGSFTVTCPRTGEVDPGKTGIMLQITERGSGKVVLVYTWLAPVDMEEHITTEGRVIIPVDIDAGGGVSTTGTSSTESIQAELPPNGLDVSMLNATCGTDPTAYIEVNVHKLGEGSAEKLLERAEGTFDSLAEVNLNVFDCGGPVEVNKDVLKKMIITIPYDSTKVSVEDLQNGVYKIYHSSNLSDFESLNNLLLVEWEDIIQIDPVAGTITFEVSHLSVFGIGPASSLSSTSGDSGNGDDNNGGCTIGMTSDWTLVALFALALVALCARRRRMQ